MLFILWWLTTRHHYSTLMRLLCLQSVVTDWQKKFKFHSVWKNTKSDNVKYYYRRSNPVPFLESYKAILNRAFYFAFEEQGGRSAGRKAAEPLNGVALMNSLLCQSFFAEIWLWESGRKKGEDILNTNRMRGGRWIYHRQVAAPSERWIMHCSSIPRKWEIEFTLTS